MNGLTGILGRLLVALFCAGPVFAEEFEHCHTITAASDRLTCYDLQSGFAVAYAKTHAQALQLSDAIDVAARMPSGDQWQLSSDFSALEDRNDIWLSVPSQNTEPSAAIGSAAYATLWLRCVEETTSMFVGFRRYTTDNQDVKFRLDRGKVQSEFMLARKGGEGIGLWNGETSIPFIRKMLGRDRLVIAYETYSGPVEFVFDISGLDQRLKPLAEECNWST